MKIYGGVLLLGLGGLQLLYIYAFASLIDPSLGEAERRSVLLTKMFVDAWATTGVAILMIVGGLMMIVSDLRRRSREKAEFEAFKHDRPPASGPSYH